MSGEQTEYGEGSKKKTKKRKLDALNEHTSPSPHVHIKTEPDSDLSTETKKSKKSKHNHKFSMKLEKNDSDEESYLNHKVKEEESKLKLLEECHSIKNESVQSGDSEFKSKLKKSKKKKYNKYELSDIEDKAKVKHKKDKWSDSEETQLSQDEPPAPQSNGITSRAERHTIEDSFSEANRHHRKKKKHTKKAHGDKIFNNMESEDHFSSAETVIITPKKRKESCKKKRLSEQIVFEDEDIINSQPLAESEYEPHATKNQSISEGEAHTAESEPSPERHEEPHSPHSMSENEEELSVTQRQPSPIKDNRGAQERLAAYVSSLSSCSVVAGAEGVEAGGEAGGEASGEVEAWVVVAPRALEPASIRYVELASASASACKLKAEGGRYVGTLAHDIPSLAVLASPGPAVQCLRLQGSIRFHKKLPKPSAAHDLVADDRQTAFIPLPPTKTRHPLFGADYRASIKIPDSVTAKLADARRIKKISKKANKVNRKETTEVEFAEEVIHVKAEKSKKKGKRKLSVESSATVVESSEPKRKKKKQRIENGDLWHSERDMEETLFNF